MHAYAHAASRKIYGFSYAKSAGFEVDKPLKDGLALTIAFKPRAHIPYNLTLQDSKSMRSI